MEDQTYEIIYKCKFKAPKISAIGLLFFSIISDSRKVGFKQILITLNQNLFNDFILDLKWDIIKERLFKLSINQSDNLNQSYTEDVMSALDLTLQNINFRNEIFELAENKQLSKVSSSINSILAEVLNSRIELQCELERNIIEDEEQKKKELENELNKYHVENADKKHLEKFLSVTVLRDDIFGIPIKKLQPNQILILKMIDKNVPKELYFKLNKSMYSEFCGEFIEFYNHENNEYAIFKLGENIFGRYCINNPNLKIKLYQTETSGEKENFIIKYITDNTLVFYILLIGLALAFILVAWFYYEWIF